MELIARLSTLRKITFILLSFLIVVSCKKGEDDRFLSLKSRKARIAGNWEVESITSTFADRKPNSSVLIVTNTQNGIETEQRWLTLKDSATKYTEKVKPVPSEILTMEKDGSFETISDKGVWIFLGKNKENGLKDGEAILFTRRETEGGQVVVEGFPFFFKSGIILKRLTNKEMTWYAEMTMGEEPYRSVSVSEIRWRKK